MRKLLVITAFLLFAGFCFGQIMQKGGVLSIYPFSVKLAANVTIDQYLDFMVNKHLPELEKHFPGTEIFLSKADRGENNNQLALIWYFKTKEERDKYINSEGWTELGRTIREKIPTWEGLSSLGDWNSTVTDWVILNDI